MMRSASIRHAPALLPGFSRFAGLFQAVQPRWGWHQFPIKIDRAAFVIVAGNVLRVTVMAVAEVAAGARPGSAVALRHWCGLARSGEQVLRIRNGRDTLCLAHRESPTLLCLAPGWQGLLVLRPGLQVLRGSAWVLPLSQMSLFKLQFFIDQGGVAGVPAAPGEPWAVLGEGPAQGRAASGLESWYLTLALQGDAAYQAFASHLRSSESYQLLGFLLEQGSGSKKLQDLAGRYGVSVSHFRRLCRQALGGPAKAELRGWRTARALLGMAEGAASLTDVALEFGYASSSHFSKDIRELLGVAPSSLIDITRLSSK